MAKKKTTPPTEPVTDQPTEQLTDQPTEQVTDQPTEQVTDQPTEQATESPTEQVTEPIQEQATESPADYLVDVVDLTLGTYTEALARLSTLAGSEAADLVIDHYETAFDNRLQQRFAEFAPAVSSALQSRMARLSENSQRRSAKRAARIADISTSLQLPEVAIIGSLPYWEPQE